MAELLIAVRNQGVDPQARDGDVVSAMSQHRIDKIHCQHQCFPRNSTGVKVRNGQLAELYWQTVCQYKFEQISRTEVRRTDLRTLDEMVYDKTPHPVDGRYINVALHLASLRRGGDKAGLFGPQNNRWYGGRETQTPATIDTIWGHIENNSTARRVDFFFAPWGLKDFRQLFCIQVDDFDEPTRHRYETHEAAVDGTITRFRRNKVDWRLLTRTNTTTDIRDVAIPVDERADRRYVTVNIVEEKPTR